MHEQRGRSSLSKATQGQIDKLSARMNTRRERIREREKVIADRYFVCAGLILWWHDYALVGPVNVGTWI